jgi:hypothetical protein
MGTDQHQKRDTRTRRSGGVSLGGLLAGAALLVVLSGLAYALYNAAAAANRRAGALQHLETLNRGMLQWAVDHDGALPWEDGPDGKDDWVSASLPEADTTWYNAVPRQIGKKGVGDFVREDRITAFYTEENPLYVAHADYPVRKRLDKPIFAIAMNGKLQTKDEHGKRRVVKLDSIKHPAATVGLFEAGVPKEEKAHPLMRGYSGAPKGSARAVAARYKGEALIAFLDGHTAFVPARELLTPEGQIPWSNPPGPQMLLWSGDGSDPNGH